MKIATIILCIFASPAFAPAQADFRTIVEERLNKAIPKTTLSAKCPIYDDWVAARVFVEYGAVYVTEKPAVGPHDCIVESDAELAAAWQFMNSRSAKIGSAVVTLQEPALNALLEARSDAAKRGIAITPRGGSTASARSYADTVALWNSRFEPALHHWVRKGRIKAADAAAAKKAPIREQVEKVLLWERDGIYFSKDLSKSILYSVAIPGASQHNFLLAIDIEQFANAKVRQIMADHGWFQTVKSDLPHFTYLGVKETDLETNGLKAVIVSGQKFWVPNINEQTK